MVDLSRDSSGRTRARLLDLVPGRSGAAYADWLKARNEAFRAGIGVATLGGWCFSRGVDRGSGLGLGGWSESV